MADAMEANRSMLNPADLAAMKQQGDGGLTVRDFLAKNGVDVDGPMSQLTKFAQKQTENAGALGKMRNIAASGQPQMPPGMPGMGGGQPPMGGFDDIMKNLG